MPETVLVDSDSGYMDSFYVPYDQAVRAARNLARKFGFAVTLYRVFDNGGIVTETIAS